MDIKIDALQQVNSTPSPQREGAFRLVGTTAARPSQPFQSALVQALNESGLKVSAHAQKRLMSRDISLDESQVHRLAEGVERAAQKGTQESLVLLDDVALVVSVRNRTIITAVDQQSMREKVFTNIDSAVIV